MRFRKKNSIGIFFSFSQISIEKNKEYLVNFESIAMKLKRIQRFEIKKIFARKFYSHDICGTLYGFH